MRPKTMILFVIAVGCGLVASIGVSQYMADNNGGATIDTEKIFVAVTNIPIGEALSAQNVKLEEWPRDRVPEGAVRTFEELEDRFPRNRLYAGEPILGAKLMSSRDRGNTAMTIPEGFRVASVKVSVESSVSGLVQPGDRVDLVVFLRKSAEVPETGTKTILRDVNVFSVDGETERISDEDTGQARNVRTVSLLVRPEQANKLLLASELGQLYLSLRRPDDASDANDEGVTVNELLGSDGESANEKEKETEGEQNSEFLNWLTDNEPANVEGESEVEPVWRMTIMTPNGSREYQWQDPDELPLEYDGDRNPPGPRAGMPAPEPEFQMPLPEEGSTDQEGTNILGEGEEG